MKRLKYGKPEPSMREIMLKSKKYNGLKPYNDTPIHVLWKNEPELPKTSNHLNGGEINS